MSRDYHYTITREGSQTIQRQTFENAGIVIIIENPAAKAADVAAMTEWGNYCYHFDSCHDVCKLLKSTDDYLMEKFVGGHGEKRELDVSATISAVTEQLRTKVVTDDFGFPNHDPRLREQRMKDLLECRTECELCKWAEVWEMDKATLPMVYRYGEAAREFLNHGLPLIRESAKQLARMKAGCTDD